MIKASAGGGGKGMRVAYNDDELREGTLLLAMFLHMNKHIHIYPIHYVQIE